MARAQLQQRLTLARCLLLLRSDARVTMRSLILVPQLQKWRIALLPPLQQGQGRQGMTHQPQVQRKGAGNPQQKHCVELLHLQSGWIVLALALQQRHCAPDPEQQMLK